MSLITDIIGDTPLVRLQRLNTQGRVFIKLESRNPGGSVKDRAAYQMIQDMLASNQISRETTIIEPTSGNTGIGLCLVAASLQLKVILIMPSTMSVERQNLIKAYGATVILSDGSLGMTGSINLAQKIQKETPNSVFASQFTNVSNPRAHVLKTGPELIYQLNQFKIEPKYFVSCVGTGGTVSGVGRVLKEQYPDIQIIAIEPENSRVLRGGEHGTHKIQGIGAGFVPEILDVNLIDAVEGVSDEDAYEYFRKLAREEGILVGISSAAAVKVAVEYADKYDCDVVAIAPDNGERYLSVEGLI
ncbi:Cysteine_synthase A [Hexamita inflata]|uniref:Cysteine synthase n=1 Tax=Hexamita inflata TaxID=28002 RepID=A0AA86UR92_9EUKA|nr:Cysteine synthase A [Hexamita inflata]